MTGLVLVFLAGYFMGMLSEYGLHFLMHRYKWAMHMLHHKDFYHLDPKEVAEKSRCIPFDLQYALYVLLALSPLAFFWGWVPVLVFFAGVFIHFVVVYETVHYLFHWDKKLPALIRQNSMFQWWRRCHLAHHYHHPRGNLSVTYPFILDRLMGTFVEPRDSYPDDPRTVRKRPSPES